MPRSRVIFPKEVKAGGQGHRIKKNFAKIKKVLPQELSMRNMIALHVPLSSQKSRSRSQGQNFDTNIKVLPQGIHTCNIKAVSHFVKKLSLRLRFLKIGQKKRSRSRGQEKKEEI